MEKPQKTPNYLENFNLESLKDVIITLLYENNLNQNLTEANLEGCRKHLG